MRAWLLIALAVVSCSTVVTGPPAARPSESPKKVATAPETGSAPTEPAKAPAKPTSSAQPNAAPARPTLTSRRYQTFIWPTPKKGGRFLGYIRVGQSVVLRQTERVSGQNCPAGFYAIEPRGYVCSDRTVTRKTNAFLRANAHTLPKSGAFPYEYALSNGAPMYGRVPTKAEQKRTEWRYGKVGSFRRLPLFQRGHEQLAVSDEIPASAMPPFLANGGSARGAVLSVLKRSIPHGSMLSYTRAFEVGGRTFLLSVDLTVVPADRVRRFRRSSFKGVKLGDDVKLPIAFFRRRARPKYSRGAAGRFTKSGKSWPVRSWVSLTGKHEDQGRQRYLQTNNTAEWALASDATVIRSRDKRPFGVRVGEKWMIVSISSGTLVGYEDMKPVYATLISPGQGGIPRKGGDPVKDSTTPMGAYRITFKDRAATMSPQMGAKRTFWIADVPFTQYFNSPFALHGTYWHESFGEPMSAGCVNASPLDAKWLFDWSDPQVPKGWQGATGSGAKENGKTTAFVVTR